MSLIYRFCRLNSKNIIKIHNISIPLRLISCSSPHYALSNKHVRKLSPGLLGKFRTMDDVPANYDLIYRAPMENYLYWTKVTSNITCSAMALLCVLQSSIGFVGFAAPVPDLTQLGLISHANDTWLFLAGFFSINLAIRYVIGKYPLRIYRSDNKYVAIYMAHLPLQKKPQQSFKRGEVAETDEIFNPWRDITYSLAGKKSFLLMHYFKTPAEFTQMQLAESEDIRKYLKDDKE